MRSGKTGGLEEVVSIKKAKCKLTTEPNICQTEPRFFLKSDVSPKEGFEPSVPSVAV